MTGADFLVEIEVATRDIDGALVDDLRRREAERARELARSGNLIRLWRVPDRWANVGIWRARDRDDLETLLNSLPLRPYMTVAVQELHPHPSDPLNRSDD